MRNDVISLNTEQKKAIEHIGGPLLVIAGAGTGKTRVIVEKIKFLIKDNQIKADEILALTFTDKAAREMEERVDQSLPYGLFQMSICTFHAFADQVLKEHAHHIGLPPRYHLMSSAESVIFLRNNLFQMNLEYFRPLGNPHKFIEALLQHFDRLKDESITPKDYQNFVDLLTKEDAKEEDIKKYKELSTSYARYQELKIKEARLDFSDLVYQALQLFKKRGNILDLYKKKYRYIFVDEFQDTNIAQYELIKLLAPPETEPKLTIVGDDSQAIYKFRGASISNILTFMKDYPTAEQVNLRTNYRSNQSILDTSYRLIKHNDPDTLEAQLGISKELVSPNKTKRESVFFSLCEKIEDEADEIAKKILEKKKDYDYSDFAILVRANSHAIPIMRALSLKGVPFQFLGPNQLYKQPEVKDLIAYLKVLANIEDSPSLYRVLTMSLFNLDTRDISHVLAFCKKISLPLFMSIEVILSFYKPELLREEFMIYKKYLPLLRNETREKLYFIYTLIHKHLKMLKEETAGQILFYFLQDSRYLNNLAVYKTAGEEKISLSISSFFDRLKSYESEHEDASVFAIVEYLDMSMELGESPMVTKTDAVLQNAVNILTVHAAKGLEFPIVFLVNLSQGRFPPYEKKETIPIPAELIKEILPQGDYHLEEERRLFYVGMTRAMDLVYLSASKHYSDSKRERKISPFVVEALGEKNIETLLTVKKEEKNQLSIFDYQKPEVLEPTQSMNLTNISYSQLATYTTCPLLYKYQYILKIPTTASSAASFGDSIHRALQAFYNEYRTDNSVDKKKLLELYRTTWIPLGFKSPSHEKKMKIEGEKMLIKFFDTFHTPHIKILDLERLFKIRVDESLSITGKIDRVDIHDNGIEIVDYKTGKTSDSDLKKSLQLSIYALAATDKGLYKRDLGEVTLSFYYLQDMKKFSMKRTPEELTATTQELGKTVKAINTGAFSPKVGPWCDFCSFRMICEAWQ